MIASQSHWFSIRQKLVIRRHTLALVAVLVVVCLAGYAILAHPWGNHQPQARQIVRAAACAGAAELVSGANHSDVMQAAMSAAISNGFRKSHGDHFGVTHSRPDAGRAFFVEASMSYRPAHFILESLIENTSQKALEVATVDQTNFRGCSEDLASRALP